MSEDNHNRKASWRDFYLSYFKSLPENLSLTGWIQGLVCPLHDDRDPSAGIDTKTGSFNCFKCGYKSPAQFLHEIDATPLEEAYRIVELFRRERELTEKVNTFVNYLPPPNPRFNTLFELSKQLMAPDHRAVEWYLEARNLTYATLLARDVGYLPAQHTNWQRDSLVFPYFLNGRCVGIRYRDEGGNKGGERDCHFTLWGIDLIQDEHETIVIMEGESDVLAAYEALGDNYLVVGTPTANFRREWKRELSAARTKILIPQADEASVKMIKSAREAIDDIHILELPWRRRQVGNDFCDWLRYHTADDFKALLEKIAGRVQKRVMSGFEFTEAASQPRQWLINNLLSRRQVAIIGGPPKSKKTWCVLNLVRSLLTMEPFLGIDQFTPVIQSQPLRFLIWEEEGAVEELYERVQMVLGDTDWEGATFWGHHLGLRLDSDGWLEKLHNEIEEKAIDILILDPFSRTYAVDEDSASEMGQVWSRVQSLLTDFEHLTIIILHHFNKGGQISGRWNSFRGSSRTAAEVDLGMFMEARKPTEGQGALIAFEGRSIRSPVDKHDNDVFTLSFDEGIMRAIDSSTRRATSLLEYLQMMGGTVYVHEAAKAFQKTELAMMKAATKVVNNKGDRLVTLEKDGDDVDYFYLDTDKMTGGGTD